MAGFFDDILESVNLDWYLKNVDGRKVVLWGKEERNKKVLEILKEKTGKEIFFVLTEDYKQDKEGKALDKKDLNREHFVIITEDYNAEIEDYLSNNGFCEIKDYLYIIHKPVIVYNEEEYTDIYNNKIKAPKGTKFEFLGYNSNININTVIDDNVKIKCTGSSIFIGENCRFGKGINIECMRQSYVKLGDKCNIEDRGTILCMGKSKISLGSPCHLKTDTLIGCLEESSIDLSNNTSFYDRTTFFAKKNSKICIGEKTHSGVHLICATYFNGIIDVGKDCMFSEDIVLMNNDGHPIFDVESGERINGGDNIILHDHVWVGIKCTLVGGTDIGEASIIGANSFVNKKFPNNCILAGSPARLLRKNIAWDREEIDSSNIDKSVFWNMTR